MKKVFCALAILFFFTLSLTVFAADDTAFLDDMSILPSVPLESPGPAVDIQSVKQTAYNEIEKNIATVDLLIAQYTTLDLGEYVDKLNTLRGIFAEQMTRLSTATESTNLNDIIGDTPSPAPGEVIRLKERLEFAARLNLFSQKIQSLTTVSGDYIKEIWHSNCLIGTISK